MGELVFKILSIAVLGISDFPSKLYVDKQDKHFGSKINFYIF